jgi:hypothetical protein
MSGNNLNLRYLAAGGRELAGFAEDEAVRTTKTAANLSSPAHPSRVQSTP